MEQNNNEIKQSQFDKFLVPGSIVVAGFVIALAVLYGGGTFTETKTKQNLSAAAGGAAAGNIEDDDPILGSPDAPVTLVEFSDFQCPFCRKLWRESFLQLKEKYIKNGKVRLVYRDFPLSGIHPGAEPAALAANCAEEQGKFWEMHDKIFFEQDKLGEGTVEFGLVDLSRWAKDIGLDESKFDFCLESGKYKAEVAADYADGIELGVTGTPHVFVNGKLLIRGALSWPQIETVIEQELAGK